MKHERKILRIKVDLAIEADEPFALPKINPAALIHVCAIVVAQHIQKSGDVRMLPNGDVTLTLCEKPPRGMTPKAVAP